MYGCGSARTQHQLSSFPHLLAPTHPWSNFVTSSDKLWEMGLAFKYSLSLAKVKLCSHSTSQGTLWKGGTHPLSSLSCSRLAAEPKSTSLEGGDLFKTLGTKHKSLERVFLRLPLEQVSRKLLSQAGGSSPEDKDMGEGRTACEGSTTSSHFVQVRLCHCLFHSGHSLQNDLAKTFRGKLAGKSPNGTLAIANQNHVTLGCCDTGCQSKPPRCHGDDGYSCAQHNPGGGSAMGFTPHS